MRGFALVLAASGWILACSSGDNTPNEPTTPPDQLPSTSSSGSSSSSSGSTSSSSSGGSSSSSGGNTPLQDCLNACEAQHPSGAKLNAAIDQCWSQSCATQCNGIGTGAEKGPTSGSCKEPVQTPSTTCSQCTVDHCCTPWDACFTNQDCIALNQCSIACYSK